MTRLTLDAIEEVAGAALMRAGASAAQARPVARSIRRAEADGTRAIGLGTLALYLGHLRGGRVDGRATPVMAHPRAAVVTVDAGHGFAHPAFDAGRDALVAAARACGTASLAITRSYSIGVLGHPAEDIAAQGLVVLAATNAPPNLIAWGGRTKVFGTNPLAFAVPRQASNPGDTAPLVIDQSSTVVTRVALAAKAAEGATIPEGWAFDAEGRPTTDAKAALAGSMAPFGGAKGANMALLVEILAAVLGGAALSKDVMPYGQESGAPPAVGQFFVAFDPAAFAPGFGARLEALALAMVAGSDARLPGDRRLAARAAAARNGVEVPDDLLRRIAEAAP
jgi:(2R)-3-sulfolactate dehydrogenase (NADP+)